MAKIPQMFQTQMDSGGMSIVGFKADINSFYNAIESLNSVQRKLSNCEAIIETIQGLDSITEFSNLKDYIKYSGIDTLKNKVDTIKQSLMKLDLNFANEYLKISESKYQTALNYINSIKKPFEELSEEEKNKLTEYNLVVEDYNRSLLYTLEKYEDEGILPDELKNVLPYQRLLVKQYDISKEMENYDITSSEYRELFEDSANNQREMIRLNPNLTEEQKNNALIEFEKQYNESLEKINNKIKEKELIAELQSLYEAKDKNRDVWQMGKENDLQEAIIKIKMQLRELNPETPYAPTTDEEEWLGMSGGQRFGSSMATLGLSTVTGVVGVFESVVDGTVMAAGHVGSVFGGSTEWAEDFVGVSLVNNLYKDMVTGCGVNTVTAYSGWQAVGNFVGSTATYIGIGYLTGGALGAAGLSQAAVSVVQPLVMATIGGTSAMGSTGERALNSGATFDEAYLSGRIAFNMGFACGAITGGIEVSVVGKPMSEVLTKAAVGSAVAMMEPVVSSVSEYYIYGKDMVDENGNPLYDNYWDYYVGSGGVTNTLIAGAAGFGGVVLEGVQGRVKPGLPKNNKPTVDVDTPSSTAPKVDVDAPKVETEVKPTVDVDTPSSTAPKVDVDAPKVETEVKPTVDVDTSSSTAPKVDVDAPKVETEVKPTTDVVVSKEDLDIANSIMDTDNFKTKSNGYQWFIDYCTDVKNLPDALLEHFEFIKSQGYPGTYSDFVSEFVSGSFSKPHDWDATEVAVRQYGASTVLDGNALENVVKYKSLGRGDIDGKAGANFAVPNNYQADLEARLSTQSASKSGMDLSVEERAAKGINTAAAQNGFYKVDFTSEFFSDNPNAEIFYNSGPNHVVGASDAAMPGGYTYDLHSCGNGIKEVCIGDLKLNDAAADAISDFIINGGVELDLGMYDENLKGIKIKKYR